MSSIELTRSTRPPQSRAQRSAITAMDLSSWASDTYGLDLETSGTRRCRSPALRLRLALGLQAEVAVEVAAWSRLVLDDRGARGAVRGAGENFKNIRPGGSAGEVLTAAQHASARGQSIAVPHASPGKTGPRRTQLCPTV